MRITTLEGWGTKTTTDKTLYNAAKVTAPMITFWGDNDWLADPVDVAWAESQFPNLKESVHIAHFNHLDFLWAIHVKELVNDVILFNMPIKPQI